MREAIIRFALWLSKIDLLSFTKSRIEKSFRSSLYSFLLRKLESRDSTKTYDIVGGYILVFLLPLLFFLALFSIYGKGKFGLVLLGLAVLLSLYRLFDLLITHSKYTIVESTGGKVSVRDSGRYVFFAMLNFVEILFYFTALKLFFEKVHLVQFHGAIEGSVINSLYYVIVTLVTLGYGEIYPLGKGGQVFVISMILYFAVFFFFVFPIVISAITVKENGRPAQKQN